MYSTYRFDDEVKDDVHGTFTPEMVKLPQGTSIETFLEGVTDQTTDYPYSRRLSCSCARSLVTCDQCLCVSTGGLCDDVVNLGLDLWGEHRTTVGELVTVR